MSVMSGTGAVVRQGYLRKLKTMKRKYFVLRADSHDCSARLEYYESEKKFKSGAPPRRYVPLKSCFNIQRRLDLKQRHVIALYTKQEPLCLVAEGEDDLHAWLSDLLKQHQNEDTIEELLHPTQHVWQVTVQKKGLGASKNIIGLYNVCLTDKTLTLVKIRANNNVIVDLGIPDGIEFSLRNIRRCGDSECFFYMEVGRQTATGAGELWMHTDDANIAQSMHSTIYHAMCNCKDEKDILPLTRNRSSSASEDTRSTLPSRRSVYSDSTKCRTNLINNAIDDDQANNALITSETKLDGKENTGRTIKHHRTVSLPTTCMYQVPLKIVHERTRSAPLTGDEVDCAILEKAVRHSSCKAVNGTDALSKKTQWSRRASTGTRLSKLSPAHTKNAPMVRNRCDSMPSRMCPPMDAERTPSRHHLDSIDSLDLSRDETDASEWHRTPRIPEEPDYCEMGPTDLLNGSSVASRGSRGSGALSVSSLGSCTEERSRAYSVGSRPVRTLTDLRSRAYSVGSRRPQPAGDLMELDFTRRPKDEYVDMTPQPPPPAPPVATTPDGYVEMSYGKKEAPGPLNYAALDLQPRGTQAPAPPQSYTQIDFARSDHMKEQE